MARIFIAYHGTDDPNGSVDKAKEIYSFLKSNGIDCYFFPECGSECFGNTPTEASLSELFILVVNKGIRKSLDSKGALKNPDPIYKEIQYFGNQKIYKDAYLESKIKAYCYDGFSCDEANSLHPSLCNVSSLDESKLGKDRCFNDLLKWAQKFLNKQPVNAEKSVNRDSFTKSQNNKSVTLKHNNSKNKPLSKVKAVSLILAAALLLSGIFFFVSDKYPPDTDKYKYKNVITGNMVNDGLVFEKDGVIYYQSHNDNWYLYKEENGNHTRLNTDNSWCICSDGEYVYYANVDDGSSVYRVKTNGEDRQKLNSDNCYNLILHEDYVFYIDSNQNRPLYRMKKDGSERQKIVDECVYDAVIDNGKIYGVSKNGMFSVSVDGSDFGFICKESGKDINVFNHTLYFISRENNRIYSVKTDGSELTKISGDEAGYLNVCEGYIFYQNLSAEGRLFSIEINTSRKKKINNENSQYINITSDRIYYRTDSNTKKIYFIYKNDVLVPDTETASSSTNKVSTSAAVRSTLDISRFTAQKTLSPKTVEFSWHIYSNYYISDWILCYTVDNDDATYWISRCDDKCQNMYKYFSEDSNKFTFSHLDSGQTVHLYMIAIDISGEQKTSETISIVL